MSDFFVAPTFERVWTVGQGYDLALKKPCKAVDGVEKRGTFSTQVHDNRDGSNPPIGTVGRIQNKLTQSKTTADLQANTGLSVGAALTLNYGAASGSLEAKASQEMCSNSKRSTVFCLCSSQVQCMPDQTLDSIRTLGCSLP